MHVDIREVGPRDGFQNEPEIVPTDTKVRLIELLAAAGLKRIEVTSFVRADVIPQLADGLERVLGRAREEGLRCEAVLSVAFGCPYEGHVPPERVFALARALRDAGAQEIGFGDTTGMANPVQVREFFPAAREALGDDVGLTAHFHNARGQGLANVLAALDAGVRSFEASFGELGGCPVPAGATGNIATEDLVYLLHGMGYETGIELDALLACSAWLAEQLGKELPGLVAKAGGFAPVAA